MAGLGSQFRGYPPCPAVNHCRRPALLSVIAMVTFPCHPSRVQPLELNPSRRHSEYLRHPGISTAAMVPLNPDSPIRL